MFKIYNLKQIFLAALLIAVVPTLCMAEGPARSKHGTRVNAGAHANNIGGGSLRLIVHLVNPSDSTITINDIKIFNPDGDLQSPTFSMDNLPLPPFTIEPFGSKGFNFADAGIVPINFPPPSVSVFQVHTTWEAEKPIIGLKGYSVVLGITPFIGGVVSRIAVEGFDLPAKKPKDD